MYTHLWIVIASSSLIISPLILLKPTKRQRKNVDLLNCARLMGLNIKLKSEEWPYWLEFKPPKLCLNFYLLRKNHSDIWCYWQVSPGKWLNRWREECTSSRLLVEFMKLPQRLYKIEACSQALNVCWEGNNIADLKAIDQVLQRLS